ncbi:MAG: hypothetical protein CMJ34_05320 [Phycisphaerae bacterium]|nr:hypothetical protein [Phycisphaerae bacterium]
MSALQSSNPALSDSALKGADWWSESKAAETATISGVVNKTGLFAIITTIAGAGGYAFFQGQPKLLPPLMLVNVVVSIGMFFLIRGSATRARNFGFVYSVLQGLFLGGVAMLFDGMLASRGIAVAGGVAVQAFVITVGCLISMLALFRAGILTGGPLFTSIIKVAVAGVMVAVLISWVLWMFGINTIVFNPGSAFASGNTFLIGMVATIFLLGLASLTLILDFRQAQDLVESGAPKETEWYAAFGLIASLVWIYYESLKLVLYITMMNRD